jgi:hypothetical protein
MEAGGHIDHDEPFKVSELQPFQDQPAVKSAESHQYEDEADSVNRDEDLESTPIGKSEEAMKAEEKNHRG